MRRHRLTAALAGLLAVLAVGAVAPGPAAAATALVYTTFKGDAVTDEELWVYRSTNGGTSYSVLADTNYRGPSGVLRDPRAPTASAPTSTRRRTPRSRPGGDRRRCGASAPTTSTRSS